MIEHVFLLLLGLEHNYSTPTSAPSFDWARARQ
jgi:hypothetical protein